MKRQVQRDLPKTPVRGERITFVDHFGRNALHGRVQHASGGRRFTVKYHETVESHSDSAAGYHYSVTRPLGYHYTVTLSRRDEGKRWVRGWDTDEAKAMAVAIALSDDGLAGFDQVVWLP